MYISHLQFFSVLCYPAAHNRQISISAPNIVEHRLLLLFLFQFDPVAELIKTSHICCAYLHEHRTLRILFE